MDEEEELDVAVSCDEGEKKGVKVCSFTLKTTPFAAKWGGTKLIDEDKLPLMPPAILLLLLLPVAGMPPSPKAEL